MNDFDYTITLPLAPHGKQSIRTGQGRAFTAPKTRRWMNDAARLFAAYLPSEKLEGPYRVDILAVVERPQYMRKRFKRTGEAKYGEGLLWAPCKPDIDNIRKGVQDALERHLTDDKAIVDGRTVKVYSEIDGLPRVVVRIRNITEWPSIACADVLLA